MEPSESALEVLKAIRDEIKEVNGRLDQTNAGLDQVNGRLDQTNAGLDQVNGRLDQTNAGLGKTNRRLDKMSARIDQTNARLDTTNSNLDHLRDELVTRIVHSEIRTATAITDLAGTVREMTNAFRASTEMRPRLERCEDDIRELRDRMDRSDPR